MRGWSSAEVEHAQRIFAHAESVKHPHVRMHERMHLGLAVLMLSFAAAGFVLLLLPALVFSRLIVSLPLLFLVGICAGLLYAHLAHQHWIGAAILAIASFAIVALLVRALQPLFLATQSALLLALAYTAGLVIAYFERRLYGPA